MSEWIEHDGVKRPVPAETLVDVKWTTGEVFKRERADFWFWSIPLDANSDEEGPSGVISAYRIISDRQQPSPSSGS